MIHPADPCPDCAAPAHGFSRREFLRTTAAGALAVAGQCLAPTSARAIADPAPTSETLAGQLFGSLNPTQKQSLCFDFDDPLRDKVDNNWLITKKSIQDTLNPDQRDLVRQIFRGLHHPDFADRAMEQMVHDSENNGFEGGTSVALFGTPGSGKFEFVLTGRHCTRRCDGDAVKGAAFGGPIFYGHQAGSKDTEPADHPGNVFWYQAKRANEVFQALDGKQRAVALIDGRGRSERGTETVKLAGRTTELPGLRLGDMTRDQKDLVRRVMADLLSPFREVDAEESMRLATQSGFDDLRLAYFKQQDLGDDGVWDVWQIEGPHMVWYFRGSPHVHCWVHIRDPRVVGA
ncbi:MAG: DUF3500 domain-containing protein [Verrucomicrobiales bacterium]|nr:DUF3500 domain-containing protein [Verrucomicrobiales bacterium]